jgi:hypothetical protein
MVLNLLPLFLKNVLGVKTNIIGVIEGVAETTASLLQIVSGWLSDRLRSSTPRPPGGGCWPCGSPIAWARESAPPRATR